MSITYINAELRRLVEVRAAWHCEYCLIAEEDTCLGCQVDHIIGEKHGGPTTAENLSLACVFCNQAKGSDIGSISWETNSFVRFFNPRTDSWSDHFVLKDYRFEARTEIGNVTIRILRLNAIERLLERQALALVKRYPTSHAKKRIGSSD